jgi:hypothetical protein
MRYRPLTVFVCSLAALCASRAHAEGPSLNAVHTPATMAGGGTGLGEVGLTAPAPTGGISVALASNNAALSVPASMLVPAGHAAAAFGIHAAHVAVQQLVTVTATYNGISREARTTVVPAYLRELFVPENIAGGASATGVVRLAGTAGPGPATVGLSSDNAVLTVDPSVAVPEGHAAASFTVHTTAVDSTVVVTVSATLNDATKTRQVNVNPAGLLRLALQAEHIVGGHNEMAYVALSGNAGAGGVSVSLGSNNPVVEVPASVTVAENTSAKAFVVKTHGVDAQVDVTISAAYAGVTRTAHLIVLPAQLQAIGASHNVFGGREGDGAVALNGAAGPSGKVVELHSSSPLLAVPASVNVAPGAWVRPFSFTTHAVTTEVTVTITASSGGVTRDTQVVLHPAVLYGLLVDHNPVVGGTGFHLRVQLAGRAPEGGIDVSLSSSNADTVPVPATVHINAGEASVTIEVHTHTVSAPAVVTITGIYHGVTKTVEIHVNPA